MILLVLIGYASFDFLIERKLIRELSALVNKNPDNLYYYSIKDLDLVLVDGSVSLKDIGIHPKQSSFDSLQSMTNDLHVLIGMKIKLIKLKGLEISKFIKTGEIEMGDLQIRTPEIGYYFNGDKKKGTRAVTINRLFSENFKSAKIGELNFENGSIEIQEINQLQPAIEIEGITLRLEGAYADSMTIARFAPFEYEEIFLRANGISIKISEDYTVVSEELYMDVKDQSLLVRDFQVQPRLNREAYAEKMKFQKNWMALKIAEIHFNGIDIDRFVRHEGINIRRIAILEPNLAIYKDKTKQPPKLTKKFLPGSSIKSMPWSVNVDSIIIDNGLITVNEKSRLMKAVSNLTFNTLHATAIGFTNVDTLAKEFIVKTNLRPMNATRLTAELKFDLSGRYDKFWVMGKMEAAEAKLFNGVLAPELGVRMVSGNVQSLSFAFSGMDTLSQGMMDFIYSDLKMEILNSDTTKSEKRGFLSFAANSIVRSNNTGDNYRQGIIYSPRDLDKGFFPFFWHSIQSGLISTLLPITNSKEAKKKQREAKQNNEKQK